MKGNLKNGAKIWHELRSSGKMMEVCCSSYRQNLFLDPIAPHFFKLEISWNKLNCCWSKAPPAHADQGAIVAEEGAWNITAFARQSAAAAWIAQKEFSLISRQQLQQQLLCNPDDFLLMYNLVVLESKTKTSHMSFETSCTAAGLRQLQLRWFQGQWLQRRGPGTSQHLLVSQQLPAWIDRNCFH